MDYEMEGTRPRGSPKKTWREIMDKDFQIRQLNKEGAKGTVTDRGN